MLNYRHLYYFWMVHAKAALPARPSADMAVQTVSAQVRETERALGHQLLRPAAVALTDAGRAAFARADEIFRIGSSLPQAVREAAGHARRCAWPWGCPAACQTGGARAVAAAAGCARSAPRLPRRRTCRLTRGTGAAPPGPGADRPARHAAAHLCRGQRAPGASSPVDWYGWRRWSRPTPGAAFPHTLQGLPDCCRWARARACGKTSTPS